MDVKTSAALITDAAPVEGSFTHIGAPARPSPLATARGLPGWDDDLGPMPDWDHLAPPEPDIELYQRVSW